MSGYDGTTDRSLLWSRLYSSYNTERGWSSSPTSGPSGGSVVAFMFDFFGRVQLGSTRDGHPVTPNDIWFQRPAL